MPSSELLNSKEGLTKVQTNVFLIYLSICLSVCLSIYQSIYDLSLSLSDFTWTCMSVCMFSVVGTTHDKQLSPVHWLHQRTRETSEQLPTNLEGRVTPNFSSDGSRCAASATRSRAVSPRSHRRSRRPTDENRLERRARDTGG